MEQDPQRELDILNLCTQVLDIQANTYLNPHGADDSSCPICLAYVNYYGAAMEDINHTPTCGWLIAKDLMAGKK